MSIKFKPLFDKVLIKVAEADKKTEGGLLLPEQSVEKPLMGTVVAVGPGFKDYPTVVKVGDVVTYGHHAGTPVKLEEEDYLMMSENVIFGIVIPKEE
jgi:chaperonin GroES